ncbi:Bacteriophage protein gp37 [Yersinia intermedia]|jgi:DNA repair photolyase|uniref:SPL family radical SAM protein n=1 Tax=Yersinia intermedia TaxID=631 RepID=UPI0001A531E1|nr:DUF5131 family protein [Yersinia intermedia]EEQ16965.1 Radical SAM domain protein [Yersinia intermedia ATCC 29909]VDZ51394.1 Bacteriophage protein gp37 [Yersinia intermedia]
MKITEIVAKSIITKSKLPDTDYVVNPYTGCAFACMYCYACFMGRFIGEENTPWGEYVYVKKNAVDLFNKDLQKLLRNKTRGSIFLSSVTDPYQNCEHKYRLTRGILQAIAAANYDGVISILTKSPLILRDIDVIKKIKNIEVGLTITSLNDKLSRHLEVNAPSTVRRLRTLSELHENGINTYCFIGPLLPHFKNSPEELENLISSIADTGVKSVYVEHINLKKYISDSLLSFTNSDSEIRSLYKNAKSEQHRAELGVMVSNLLSKYGLTLKMNQVIDHMKT